MGAIASLVNLLHALVSVSTSFVNVPCDYNVGVLTLLGLQQLTLLYLQEFINVWLEYMFFTDVIGGLIMQFVSSLALCTLGVADLGAEWALNLPHKFALQEDVLPNFVGHCSNFCWWLDAIV